MKQTFNTEGLSLVLKDLLSLEKGSIWVCQTLEERFELKFTGSIIKVQKEIYEWLKRRVDYENETKTNKD